MAYFTPNQERNFAVGISQPQFWGALAAGLAGPLIGGLLGGGRKQQPQRQGPSFDQKMQGMYRGPGRGGGDYWRGWNNPSFGNRPHGYGFGNWMQGRQNPGIYGGTFQGFQNAPGRSPFTGGGLQLAGMLGQRRPGGIPTAGYQGFLDGLQAQRLASLGMPQAAPQGQMHPSATKVNPADQLAAFMGR